MKKMSSIALLLALSLLGTTASAAVRVVTTTEDLAAIAREVGGRHRRSSGKVVDQASKSAL